MLLLFGKVNFVLKICKMLQRDEIGKIKEKGKVNLEKVFYFLVCIVQSLGNLFVKKMFIEEVMLVVLFLICKVYGCVFLFQFVCLVYCCMNICNCIYEGVFCS